MKRCIVLLVLCLPFFTLAYTPTTQDYELLGALDEKMEALFPDNVDQLVRLYDVLDEKKVEMRIRGGDRGLFYREWIKDELNNQLFRQSEVCIATHAQYGDSVQVQYTVHDTLGELIRVRTKPLVFNPGKGQVWQGLERTVLGMHMAEQLYRPIETVGVVGDGALTKTVGHNGLDTTSLSIGDSYAFGVADWDRVIVGTVSALDEKTITFDFSDAKKDDIVYISLTLESLRKACNNAE